MEITTTNRMSMKYYAAICVHIFLLTALLGINSQNAIAQTATQYSFTAFSSPYNQLYGTAGVTNLSSMQGDDFISVSVPIGFTFYFCGTPYTTVTGLANGLMTFGFTPAGNGCCAPQVTSAGYQPGVFCLWADQYGGLSPGSANYITTGTPGSRVFTLEWYKWGSYNGVVTSYSESNEYSCQVILYEGTNKIQVAFRQEPSASSYGPSSSVGIGNSVTDFQTVSNYSASPVSSNAFNQVSGLPATDQVYEWDPPICNAAPTAPTLTTVSTVVCAGASTTLNATTTLAGIGGITYQWQSAPTAAGPWTPIPGANALSYTTPNLLNTTYYRITDTCNFTVPHLGTASNVCAISVVSTSIPYIQNFDFASNPGLTNYGIPACMQSNYNPATAGTQTILSEGFDGVTFPPAGWITGPSNPASAGNPTCPSAWPLVRVVSFSSGGMTTQFGCSASNPGAVTTHNSSAGMIGFDPWFISSSRYGTIISPAVNFAAYAGGSNYRVNFYNYGVTSGDTWSVYINNTQSFTGATLLGTVGSSAGTWIANSITIPPSFLTGTAYFIIQATSAFGDDIFLDDFSITYTAVPRTMWGQLGPNMYKAADGTTLPWCVYASDTSGVTATNGKQDYITTPALPLVQGVTYRVKFGYARGASNWTNNTGTPPNNENLYLMVGTTNPVTTSATNPLAAFPNGQIWGTSITSNTPTYTTGNNITYTSPSTGAYFFSWIDNTPHSGLTTTPNGTVALDSIRIDSVGCTLAAIMTQPAATTTVCSGFPVTFSVTASGYGLTYQWFKNGNSISGATASSYTIAAASVSDAGNYTVSVNGACGGPNGVVSNIANLVVNVSPVANITAGGSLIICPTTTVNLTASAGAGYSYQWYNGTGPISGANTPTYAAGAADFYHVVVTNSNGCYTTSSNVAVTVLPAPPAVASPVGATTVCQGTCVTINANTGASLTYQWQNNGVNIPGAVNSTYNACSAGVYTVTVTGANGCFATSPVSVPIVVNPLPPSGVASSGPDTFCQNQSVTLTTPLSTGVTYQWYRGATSLNGQTTNTYIATQTGAYTLKVTNTTSGCFSTSPVTTVLVNTPAATIAAPTTSLCAGNSVTLVANTGAGLTYQWNVNGYPITGATDSIYSTSTPGNYTVTVTSTVGAYSCSNTSVPPVQLLSYSPPPAFIVTLAPTTFCAGNSLILYADTGTGYTYQWMLNGVNIPQATAPTLTASSSGNYSVTITNAFGCFGTSPATTVTVVPLPTPTVATSGTTQLCPGGNVTLSTSTGPGLSYQWYNGVSPIPGATFPVYVTSSTANYTVIVTNSTGCQGTSPAVSVVMNPNPPAGITSNGPTGICSGSNVILSAPAGYSYQWKYNGNAISGATSQNYTASSAGNYTVTVTSTAGCTSTTATATTVSVYPLPVSVVTTVGPSSVCDGGTVSLQANTGTGLNYQWSNNGVAISGATTSNYTASVSGSYTVTVTDANNCNKTSVPVQVSVYPIPAAGLIPPGDTGFCQGSSITLTAVGGAGYNYQWLKNGVNIAGANTMTYQANQPGSYSVQITANICSSVSPSKNVSVYALPVDTASLLGSTPICVNDSVKLQAYGGNGYTYQWMKNGAAITGATQSSYWVKDAAVYTVLITSNYGCAITTQTIPVTSFPPPNPLIVASGLTLQTGNFITYQWYYGGMAASNKIAGAVNSSYIAGQSGDYYVFVKDNYGCTQFSPKYTVGNLGVGQAGNGSSDVKIYPNPATSIVYIESPVKVNVKVSGIEGKMLMEEKEVKHIDISGLPNGVYMISVYDEQNHLLKVDRLLKAGQ